MTQNCIFITGAGRGIGEATARLFLERGWFVGATDLDDRGVRALEKEFGPDRLWVETLDVTNASEFQQKIETFGAATGGRLDLIHNNAGILFGGALEDLDAKTDAQLLSVNVLGVLNGVRAALPLLKQTPNSLCFATASSSAIQGVAGLAVYSATKAAVQSLTESLSQELRPHGVRVADVLPGIIDTEMVRKPLLDPDGKEKLIIENARGSGAFRLVEPREVAEAVWSAYASDDPTRLHWFVPEELEGYAAEVRSQGRGHRRSQ